MDSIYSFKLNQRYSFHFPTAIRFGVGVIDELATHLKSKNLTRPLVVTDPTMVQLPFFESILQSLKAQGIQPALFSEIAKNPVRSNVLHGVEVYHQHSCDAIVGIGGGASMDVARAITLKAYHERDLFDFDDAKGGDRFVVEKIPYFITVPTTSGTGSEVGRSTVIADDITHEKKILFSPRLMAQIVFADPKLTYDLPAPVTAATGIDALTHNIESYLAKGFSPLCDGIALEGVRLIAESLENAVLGKSKKLGQEILMEARAQMMMGSLMGATAFQKGLGIVHSLAHPLSTVVDMHHGLANAMMIVQGLTFNAQINGENAENKNVNQEQIEKKFYDLCIAAKLKVDLPQGEAISKRVASKVFIDWVKHLNAQIGIPKKLSELKVTREHIKPLAQLALQDPCHASNPKPVTQEQFFKLYEQAL